MWHSSLWHFFDLYISLHSFIVDEWSFWRWPWRRFHLELMNWTGLSFNIRWHHVKAAAELHDPPDPLHLFCPWFASNVGFVVVELGLGTSLSPSRCIQDIHFDDFNMYQMKCHMIHSAWRGLEFDLDSTSVPCSLRIAGLWSDFCPVWRHQELANAPPG